MMLVGTMLDWTALETVHYKKKKSKVTQTVKK